MKSLLPIFLVLGLLAACQQQPGAPRHLVLVVFDTLRADRMSVYGQPLETTPYLREHANEFLRFAEVAAPAPWTLPAHSSLFTGLWPSQHRAQWGSMRLAGEFETLAETLAGEGFCTVGISANPLVNRRSGLAQGFERFAINRQPWPQKTTSILEALPEVIQDVQQGNCRLFLFLNLMDTHIPYTTEPYGDQFGVRPPQPVRTAAAKWEISAGARAFTEADKQQHAAAYDAAVRYVDDTVREILSLFRDRELLDETLIVMTSDHGDGLGAHPELGHSISVWEEQLRIPLLVRFPDGSRGGEVFAERTTLTALMPSLLDWLWVPRPAALAGSPDLELAARGLITADYRSYFEEQNRGTNAKMAALYPDLAGRITHTHVVYCQQHKLLVEASGQRRFFDLISDPDEQVDLAPEETPALQDCWDEYRRLLGQGRFTPFAADPPAWADDSDSSEDLETLRALGYIQ